jgi:multiple sugar transport system ATP-binding protein
MASLQLKQVVKQFGDTRVIQGIDLTVDDGEFVVFVGPSGCGKSTLLRLICGLEEVTSGELLLDGQRVNEVAAADRGLAMVFQSYALYPHMTVFQNMAFGLQNIGTAREEVQAKVDAAAKLLQLDALLQRKPTQLSGGQRQRVAIGRAIVREPKIFLFDEPLSNLDAELRVSMRGEITALHRRLGATMIYVTHDQVEAMTMADKIVVLRAGKIEQVGSPLELYNRPDNRFVAGFIGSPRMNFVPGSLAATPVSAHEIGVRPEHLLLAPTADSFALTMQITQVEQLGGHALLYGTLSDGKTAISAQVAGQHAARPDETITLHAPRSACHYFDASGSRLSTAAA